MSFFSKKQSHCAIRSAVERWLSSTTSTTAGAMIRASLEANDVYAVTTYDYFHIFNTELPQAAVAPTVPLAA
jgi:hypothetical protein